MNQTLTRVTAQTERSLTTVPTFAQLEAYRAHCSARGCYPFHSAELDMDLPVDCPWYPAEGGFVQVRCSGHQVSGPRPARDVVSRARWDVVTHAGGGELPSAVVRLLRAKGLCRGDHQIYTIRTADLNAAVLRAAQQR